MSLKTAKLWLFALHYPLLALHKQDLSRIDDNNIKVQILSQSLRKEFRDVLNNMLIEQPARWLRIFYPHALWRMDKNDHSVYLTFDDGPIPEATPFILDILDQFNAKAMFFMVADNVRKHPEIYEEVIRRGHKVGNHTYHHLGSFKHWTLTYAVDVTKADALLNTPYFRPPHGWLRHTVYWWVKQNYRVVMWDLVTRDYSKWLSAADVVNNVKRYARNGSIITFHDSLKSIDKLRTALPESLQWLRNQGYEFKVFPDDPAETF